MLNGRDAERGVIRFRDGTSEPLAGSLSGSAAPINTLFLSRPASVIRDARHEDALAMRPLGAVNLEVARVRVLRLEPRPVACCGPVP